ncbi:MAG TPA: nitroreductase family protein [Ktedonobacterales bacterium]
MTVAETIRTQRAVREFTDEPLSEEAIHAILNAGRRSQSSKNSQPWHFVAVRDKDILRELSQCGDFAGHLAGAAMGVALVALAEPERQAWVMFDLGQAAANMQLAAWELGIGSCIAAIYEPQKAQAILRVPDGLTCDVALSFGYPRSSGARPRAGAGIAGRRSLGEVVHWDTW